MAEPRGRARGVAQIVLSFYQVWSVRESVYGFEMPGELSSWLRFSEVFSFDLGNYIFPSWTCVGGLTTRLVFNGLWPLAAGTLGCSSFMLR